MQLTKSQRHLETGCRLVAAVIGWVATSVRALPKPRHGPSLADRRTPPDPGVQPDDRHGAHHRQTDERPRYQPRSAAAWRCRRRASTATATGDPPLPPQPIPTAAIVLRPRKHRRGLQRRSASSTRSTVSCSVSTDVSIQVPMRGVPVSNSADSSSTDHAP